MSTIILFKKWLNFTNSVVIFPEYLSSFLVSSGVCVARSLVFFSFFVVSPFSFGHCIVCPSSIYGFWLPLCCHQSLLIFLQNHMTRNWRFSLGPLVSSTNKTDCQNITDILLKVVLNTLTLSNHICLSVYCTYSF